MLDGTRPMTLERSVHGASETRDCAPALETLTMPRVPAPNAYATQSRVAQHLTLQLYVESNMAVESRVPMTSLSYVRNAHLAVEVTLGVAVVVAVAEADVVPLAEDVAEGDAEAVLTTRTSTMTTPSPPSPPSYG